eukprot:SM000012S25376  [mRNA]  locus=s12:739095:740854:- [translate_table: standard]
MRGTQLAARWAAAQQRRLLPRPAAAAAWRSPRAAEEPTSFHATKVAASASAAASAALPSQTWRRRQGPGATAAATGLLLAAAASSLSPAAAAAKEPRPAPGTLPGDVTLYQYESCPFCNKLPSAAVGCSQLTTLFPPHCLAAVASAFLDYHDIPYRVVEVNPVGKKELAWSSYKKVPVLVVGEEQLNDSSGAAEKQRSHAREEGEEVERGMVVALDSSEEDGGGREGEIVTRLDAWLRGLPQKAAGGGGDGGPRDGPTQQEGDEDEEARWRHWVDGHLVHLLSPNIYRSPSEALEAFDYITTNGNFTAWERAAAKYSGAAAMYFIGKRLKKKHGIGDERADLYAAANEWVAVLDGRPFMGGAKPNLADLAVFGVLRPVRGLRTGADLVEHSRIGEWYDRMAAEVGASARLPT